MMTEVTIPAHAKGVAAALTDAGLRDRVSIRRSHEAVNVLQDGRERVPNNAEIPALLGAVYAQQAAGVEPKEQKELYAKAGDSFAAAAEKEGEDEDLYLQAGQSYDQAGEPAEAIKYYNGYLDLEPEGDQAGACCSLPSISPSTVLMMSTIVSTESLLPIWSCGLPAASSLPVRGDWIFDPSTVMVMVLPPGVNKASGLKAALADLGIVSHKVVGVGDAENDHAFLRLCGCAAAVRD